MSPSLGWIVAEVGRQPWTVYVLLKTANGISSVPTSDVLLSVVLISAFYLILIVFEIYFIKKTWSMRQELSEDVRFPYS